MKPRERSPARLAARRFGLRAERQAEWLLRLKLFRIVARNYRVRDGEIDIIARRGSLIAFVEVKGRPSIGIALEAITPRKQARVSRAAGHWLARHPWATAMTLRADAIVVVPHHLPRHVTNLFALAVG